MNVTGMLTSILAFLNSIGRKGLAVIITPDDYNVLYSVKGVDKRIALLREVKRLLDAEIDRLGIIEGKIVKEETGR